MTERLKPTMTEMMQRVSKQTEEKILWEETNNPVEIANMLAEEVSELKEAISQSLNSGDIFSVASEIGDVLYLALKFCASVNLTPEDVVQLKILRNDLKYPNDLNSRGEYQEQRNKSKLLWEALGGDEAFSHAYLEVFANLEDPEYSDLAKAMQNTNGQSS